MSMAVSRYRDSALIANGEALYYGRRTLPSTAPKGDDRYVDVQFGDTLQSLAHAQYGDFRLWWVIADFNDIIDPTVDLVAGQTLRIPSTARLWMEVLR